MDVRARLEVALGEAEYRLLTRGAARVLGFARSEADIDGVRVPFFARGWGVPVLLVHGFGGDKESWLLMAGALAKGRSVIIPDLPGFGAASAIPPERAAAKWQAQTLGRLLDRLGYGRAHLVGNSMGGGIALRFADDYPERTSSITLIGSVGPVVERSETLLALDRGENPLIVEGVEDMDRLMKLVAERAPPVTRAMRRYLATDRVARRDAQAALFRGWNDPNDGEGLMHLKLEAIRAPALVIHGERDRVIHPSTGRALADGLPNARLEMLEKIGHVPQMEVPRKVARSVDAFIDEIEAQRAAS